MTYPARLYVGDAGEALATIRRDGAPPDVTYANGSTTEYLARGASTGGLFGLYRWTMSPTAGGAGPHFHRTLAESFFVLDGSLTVFDGRTWLAAAPGDFVHVPPGGLHGFRNDSGAVVRFLLHFAPGAPREAYFEGLARWGYEGRPSDDEAADFLRRHDNVLA